MYPHQRSEQLQLARAALTRAHAWLQVLLDNDVDDVCPDTRFVIESSFFGRTDAVELKPGGASIPLTNANAREFADLAARHTMTTAIRDAVVAFQAGLWEMVPLATLRVFSHAELELMISGLPDIDVADLRRSAAYGGGLAAGERLAVWFWQVAEELPKQDVALLVQFVTGAPPSPSLWVGSAAWLCSVCPVSPASRWLAFQKWSCNLSPVCLALVWGRVLVGHSLCRRGSYGPTRSRCCPICHPCVAPAFERVCRVRRSGRPSPLCSAFTGTPRPRD